MGGAIVPFLGEVKEDSAKMTMLVFLSFLVAATGGLIFGYDIGISGGVTSMESFLSKFFPEVYRKEGGMDEGAGSNQYCKFDSQLLTAFTSSLYLAALIASWFAPSVMRAFGRKWPMFSGGITFLAGAVVNGAATDVAMLIIGRILLGVGVGFVNQSAPVYLSEMAPAKLRGMLNIGFQLMITLGILCANLINYGASKVDPGWGWRISLALVAVPAVFITLGSFFLPDTPVSLMERGLEARARDTLCKIRGTGSVQQEFADLKAASDESKKVKHPWHNITLPRYRPHLTMAILIPFFQQLTGINGIMFYAPVLFKTIGFGNDAALFSALITRLVNVFATLLSIFTADRLSRRSLFLLGGTQMFVSQIIVGTLIGAKLGLSGQGHLSLTFAGAVVGFICIHVAGFAWSWGALGWLVPSEIFPLEVRSAGLSITVSVSMFFTFVIAQAFLALLCKLQCRLFYLFGVCLVIMTAFTSFFLPETKGVPIEEMVLVWKAHWFWGRFISDEVYHVGGRLGNAGVQVEPGPMVQIPVYD